MQPETVGMTKAAAKHSCLVAIELTSAALHKMAAVSSGQFH